MVPARAVSDDEDRIEVHFDAEPWFAQATSQQLRRLENAAYCSSDAADEVLRWIEFHTKHSIEKREIKKFMKHVQRSDFGFEVYIDPEAARQWLIKPALDAVDTLLGT